MKFKLDKECNGRERLFFSVLHNIATAAAIYKSGWTIYVNKVKIPLLGRV